MDFDQNQMGMNGRFTSQGIPIVFMYSDHPSGISVKEERRMRRVLKENKIFGHLPQTTPKLPSVNVREEKEAYYRRSAARIPSEVHTWNARVFITDAAGRTVEWEAGSYSSATGGSVLKRPRVDLGEASHVLAGDLKPGQDSSATGTIEEVNGGSVLNKDLGGSSEIVVNNLNPGGDPFVDASSDT